MESMTEQVSYFIWGSAFTSTRAFKSVSVDVNPTIQRVFVKVSLRWWLRGSYLS